MPESIWFALDGLHGVGRCRQSASTDLRARPHSAGRDFDRLARAMAPEYRVVCPDVVGRGRSDYLRDPMHYIMPQYVADMVTLIARLNVEQVDWVGTSMGGLIGIGLAGQANSPIRRLVINDVGPRLDAAAIARIGDYVGASISFTDVDEAVDYISTIAAPFGLTRREDWRARRARIKA